ncbi:MAG: peptide chain release factor N(5)-glutamine methyltransferase [Ignavibacteriae bacterium]|nr:peptide chain release factor N(5)-glutamine methyltransferase [Ignavibacteriota bacterium]
MLNVLSAIELSKEYLEKKGIESPRINADLLLADILNCKRMDLYLKFDQPLAEEEIHKYREYIARRGKGEPLQYIVGEVEFYGLNFKVNPNALIPRPETEILVENIITNTNGQQNLRILDIGTGSGNIIVSLVKNIKNSEGVSIDLSEEAIEVAKENSLSQNLETRIAFLKKDVLKDDLEILDKFDIIVSNPPYVSNDEYNSLQKEITNHEPKNAVTDFGNGLTFYETISEKAKNILQPKGKLYFEVGIGQAEQVQEIMQKNNFEKVEIVKDYSSIDRIVFGELE